MSVEEAPELTRNQRYYARHREEKRQKVRDRYHNDPIILARRAERERLNAEKRALKEVEKALERAEAQQRKKAEKEKRMEERNQERLALLKKKKVEQK